MIKLKIIHERFNEEPIFTTMYGETFFIGSSRQSDVKAITYSSDTYLQVIQDQTGVFIKSLGLHHFYLNGKKYQGQIKCHTKDIIQIDRTTIEILDINLEKIAFKVDLRENNTKEEYKSIIKLVQKELIYSDKEF